ncbi:membrane protein [Enterococcus saigonensis]|uniref:Membrane protein n=1 Tax=Enterococcus saigonensis TaxID=1805431 RepID=A0A679IIP7_9ENTE|nr:hypothetical protein [Enterococcus saigonensis]BCA85265.1 membrane protein [Enterococcus saigonensis]
MKRLNNETKKKYNKKMIWIPYLLVIAVFITVGIFFIHALNAPFSQSSMAEIKDTWVYYAKDDPVTLFKSRYVKRLNSVSAGETMVMERTMIRKVSNPTLLIQGNHQWLKVTVDGKILYQHSSKTATPTFLGRKNPGNIMTEVQLPKNYVGKTLRLEVSSPYKNYAGIPARVFIGDSDSLLSYVVSVSLPQILILIICTFISLAIMIFSGAELVKRKNLNWELILLSCFALTIALEAAAGDILAGLLFSPLVNSTMALLLAIFTPIFLISYYCLKMKQSQKYYRLWVIFHISFDCLILLWAVLTKIDLPEVKFYIDAANIFGTLATTIAAITEAHQKNRFFVICTPWIVLVAMAHCFIYITSVAQSNFYLVNISGLLFAIILLVIFVYTLVEGLTASEQNKRQMHFLELKTELLEDNHETIIHHLQELEQLRQDFKQNLLLVKDLSSDGNLPAVNEYLEKLLEETDQLNIIRNFSEHTLTNLILNRYQKNAQQKSIAINFLANLPQDVNVADDDLSQILIHLLEHATRETYAIHDPKKREINLRIEYMNEKLQISCTHTAHYHTNIFDRGITTNFSQKEELDLFVIEKVAKKYRGQLKQLQDDYKDQITLSLSLIT